MSINFEQRLRAEMEQVTVSPRPGLVNGAYRSFRGKRRTIRTVAAAGTALAIAAGAAAGVAAATASPTAIPTQTTAYVVSHVSSALATSYEISYTTVATVTPDNTPATIYFWKYGTRFRDMPEIGSQPQFDEWAPGWGQPGDDLTIVNYLQRSWARYGTAHDPAGVPSFSCQQYGRYFFPLSVWEPADVSSIIESGLRCGAFQMAGHQQLDGIDTIKLTGIYDGSPLFTLWVDASTYLPVQMAGNKIAMQFRWLPPTQANLAQLTGTIPPGFHRSRN